LSTRTVFKTRIVYNFTEKAVQQDERTEEDLHLFGWGDTVDRREGKEEKEVNTNAE